MNGHADDGEPQADHRDVIADFLDSNGSDGNGQQGDDAGGNDATTEPGAPDEPGDQADEKSDDNADGNTEPRAASRIQLPGADPARRWVDWLANRPTPGGIFLMIGVILFFLFAFVPMGPNGETRLFLIWRSLTGGAKVPPDTTTAEAEQAQKADAEAAFQALWTGGVAVITDELGL